MADDDKEAAEPPRASYNFDTLEFELKDYIEEIATLITERSNFLESKIQRRTIGKEEQNLARYRLARMRAMHGYLRRIAEHKGAEQAVPSKTSVPVQAGTMIETPASAFRAFAAEVEAAADAEEKFDFSKLRRPARRVEEKPALTPETLPPEEKTEPEQSPPVDDWDD